MAKRKKISKLAKAKADPRSRYWRSRADKLWSEIVRKDGHCLVCGATEYLQAHHLISRWVLPLRHDLRNGLSLCPLCHKFGRKISGHKSPFGLAWFLQKNQPQTWRWLMRVFDNWDEYVDKVADYKKAYERLMKE